MFPILKFLNICMFQIVDITRTPSSERMVELWGQRYTVDVSSLSQNPKFYGELINAALPESRSLTAAKLLNNALANTTNQIATQAQSLYDYIPDIIGDFHMGERITEFAFQIYQRLLESYQQQSGVVINTTKNLKARMHDSNQFNLTLSTIPKVEDLANQLEALLFKYQDLHLMAKNWRVVGFLTTLFNFTNKSLVNQLTSVEKVLVCPYFKFIEEHIAIPWQRICAVAAKHERDSESLALVEQMFPLTSEISSTVYWKILESFPAHLGARGGLGNPDVAHSCLRDFDMFQAYLWLCVLEGNQQSVKQELVRLCVMVMPNVGVRWEMIDKSKQMLFEEIEKRISPKYKPLLLNYTQNIEAEFYHMRKEMCQKDELVEVPFYPEEDTNSHPMTIETDSALLKAQLEP